MIDSDESEIQERLQQRFPDYRKAKEYMSDFYLRVSKENPGGYRKLLEDVKNGIEEAFEQRLSKYRLPKENRPPSNKRLLQCPYCFCWFEVPIGGNGKLRDHCGQIECKRNWDRSRRRK
jgi:hypothetical protein